MKSVHLLLLLFIITVQGYSQETANLSNCIQWALDASQLKKSYCKYDSLVEFEIKNIRNNWFPELNLNGKYSYLSEVTEMSLGDTKLPFEIEFPEASKHQYGVTLEMKQTIWDGGMTKATKAVKIAENATNKKQLDVDLYAIKLQVSSLYFSIMLFQKQLSRLDLYEEILNKQKSRVEVAFNNGTILETNLYIIEAELINLKQQKNDLQLSFLSARESLQKLTHKNIDSLQEDSLPTITQADVFAREELLLFDSQKERLDMSKKISSAQRMPKLYAFGTFGYGYPGLDMFSESAHDYFIVGAGFSWNIFDWNEAKRQRQIADIHKSLIDDKKTNFIDALNVKQQSYISEIKKLEIQLENDNLLIDLRQKITQTMQYQLDNGVITMSDYINEFNKEKEAVLMREIHDLQLKKAHADYLLFAGKL
ncbi:MAG: TolC family protein [Bacteroidales bacterium]|nr:TolC family protein [Bacteroidales bacterium]